MFIRLFTCLSAFGLQRYKAFFSSTNFVGDIFIQGSINPNRSSDRPVLPSCHLWCFPPVLRPLAGILSAVVSCRSPLRLQQTDSQSARQPVKNGVVSDDRFGVSIAVSPPSSYQRFGMMWRRVYVMFLVSVSETCQSLSYSFPPFPSISVMPYIIYSRQTRL